VSEQESAIPAQYEGSIAIIPPHIEVHSFGYRIIEWKGGIRDPATPGKWLIKPVPYETWLKTRVELRCTKCTGERTIRFRRSTDQRQQDLFDDEAAEGIVQFVLEHPASHHT